MKAILDLLKRSAKALAPSREYRERLAEINLAAAQATVDALAAQRDALLLRGGESELEEIEGRIRSAQREVDRQRVAQTELTRLAEAAARHEAEVAMSGHVAAAAKISAEVTAQTAAFHKLIDQAGGLIDGIHRNNGELRALRQKIVAGGLKPSIKVVDVTLLRRDASDRLRPIHRQERPR